METKDKNDCCADAQADIYRLALSLDSLFVNGIQFGLIQATSYNGFLERQSEALLKDLDVVEKDVPHAPVGARQDATRALEELRSSVVDVTDYLARLMAFRSLSLPEVLATVSHLGRHREKGVRLIEGLEKCFGTPKPFYAARSEDAAAAVDAFLADLPRVFELEWNAARSKASAHSA